MGFLQDGGLVVLGAIVALGPTLLIERFRDRRGLETYWRDQRRSVYATFLGCSSRLENDTVRIGRLVGALDSCEAKPVDPETLRHPELIRDRALRAAVAERNASAELMTDAYETLRLICPPPSATAARSLLQASNRLLELARSGRFEADVAWEESRSSLQQGRSLLRQAARSDLGVDRDVSS